MKQNRQPADFIYIVICILLNLSAVISAYGGDIPKSDASKPSPTVTARFDIQGTVIDTTPDISEETVAKLEQATSEKSSEKCEKIIERMCQLSSPVTNAVVTVKSQNGSFTKTTVTDTNGNFRFVTVPSGDYEVFAQIPSRPSGRGIKRMATARERVRLDSNRKVDLRLRVDLVVVSGRITDVNGKPISGAKVTGELDQFSKEGVPDTISTVSSADGSYELSGFEPPDIYHIAGFLAGGNPAVDYVPFHADILVESDELKGKARILLVTDELLAPARRLLKVMSQMSSKNRGGELQEKKDLPLPSSHGNTITGIDVMLKKAGEGVK